MKFLHHERLRHIDSAVCGVRTKNYLCQVRAETEQLMAVRDISEDTESLRRTQIVSRSKPPYVLAADDLRKR